jgi:septum formation protein
MPLILASASPRRRQLLAACGIAFQVMPAAIDERPQPDEAAAVYVQRLAMAKARAIGESMPDAVILGADTIVSRDGLLLGKPQSEADARRMLDHLSGQWHEVLTGVAVLAPVRPGSSSGQCAVEVVSSRVLMRQFSTSAIDWYLATGEPMDKAGAYAVQGLGAALVERVEGSYTNVVGLPLTETLLLLRRCGLAS